jgi:hypothetical protein
MQHFSLTVDAEALDATLQQLWDTMHVRGEVEVRPLTESRRFRVDVIAEHDLTPAQLEKLTGKRPG